MESDPGDYKYLTPVCKQKQGGTTKRKGKQTFLNTTPFPTISGTRTPEEMTGDANGLLSLRTYISMFFAFSIWENKYIVK